MVNPELKMWFLIAIVVTGVYVMPSAVAKFSGSHTMEFNASGTTTNASLMSCGQCHQYIVNELNATDNSDNVAQAHINALQTEDYANVSSDAGAFLHLGTFSGITTSTVCALCHSAETSISGAHTQVVTRACTDKDCHGYNITGTETKALIFNGQNVTQKLMLPTDAHSGWYNAFNAKTSDYSQANASGNYTYGFFVCLGCHTHTGMSLNLSRPQVYNVNISRNNAGTTVSDPAVNDTTLNQTISYKPAHSSMWT